MNRLMLVMIVIMGGSMYGMQRWLRIGSYMAHRGISRCSAEQREEHYRRLLAILPSHRHTLVMKMHCSNFDQQYNRKENKYKDKNNES